MRIEAVLFDIDGTLISSGGAGGVAWQHAFEDLYDIPADIGKHADNGMTDPEVGLATFRAELGRDPEPGELEKVIERRQHHLPEAVAASEGYRVMPGVVEALERLKAEGLLVGLLSGGMEPAAHTKLARGDLNRFFAFGGFGTDSPDRSEITRIAIRRAGEALGHELEPAAVLVVGDTPKDVAAAHAQGALALGVATGKYDADALREAGFDAVVETLEGRLPLAEPDA